MADEKKPFRKLTWRLAVIAKCRVCCCGSPKAVKECASKTCPLWHFRMGKAPKIDVNALEILVFDDDPTSVVFRARKPKNVNDDGISVVNTEYSAYIEDDELEDDDEVDEE